MADEQQPAKIRVECPHCGAVASAPAEYAGRRVKCANTACRQSFDVPAAKPVVTQAARKAAPAANPFTDDDFDEPVNQSARPMGSYLSAVASNPGRVRFNPLQWWRHQPLGFVLGAGGALFFLLLWLGLVMSGHSGTIANKQGGQTPLWLFSPAILATLAIFTWNQARRFSMGDANPGVVVALNPTLIAVPTDLTLGHDEYPVIKILKVNMKTADGKPLEIGSRVPTIAVYQIPKEKTAGHWGDFLPLPAEYATNDSAVLRRLLASFPKEQYEFLQQALKWIEQPLQPGLYALWEAPGKRAGRRIKRGKDF
jgi:hypothetical protein